MELSCPTCEKYQELELESQEREVTIRNEQVKYKEEFYKCKSCGEEFITSATTSEPMELAFREYRTKQGMLQPEEILSFRKRYHLSQGELSKLLGLGGATISRYENGKLQDETHDKLLRLAMDCENLKKLVVNSEGIFSERKEEIVLNAINDNTGQMVDCLREFIIFNLEENKPDEYRGFKKFDIEKFTNSILYFCTDGVVKTKLNKLMYYADFCHFRDYTVSITGSQYARIPFGPAPNNYDLYYPTLIRQNVITIEELEYPRYSGESYTSAKEVDIKVFTDGELRVLASVKEQFGAATASEISAFSHNEEGYKSTENGKIISYKYASSLKV